jgi:hypothetical protein
VSEGDLIKYREGPDGDARRLARVLGLATHDGCGKKYDKPRLAVLATDDFLTHGFERHVELDAVVGIRKPGPFATWFLFGQMPDIDTAYSASEYGVLTNSYIAPYLLGSELRKDWREVANDQTRPKPEAGDYAGAVATASAQVASLFSYEK